jgi:hypothetical protein
VAEPFEIVDSAVFGGMGSGPTVDFESGDGAVVRFVTSAEELRGGIWTVCSFEGDGEVDGCGAWAEFEAFDTIELRLLFSKTVRYKQLH